MVAVEENDERDTEQEEEDEEGEEDISFRGGWIVEEGTWIFGDRGACDITSLSLTHSWCWSSSSSWLFFWGLHLLMQEPIVREGIKES